MEKKLSNDDDLLKFVNLVEEHKIILSKSQLRAIKAQKREAVADMIVKWSHISGQTLNEQTLLKKLHNMKSRMNTAAEKNILTDWQSKLRELTVGTDSTKYTAQKSASSVPNDEGSSTLDDLAHKDIGQRKRTAEDILDEWETDDTKILSDEQLQRYVMLKHLKLVSLKIDEHQAPIAVQIVELPNEADFD